MLERLIYLWAIFVTEAWAVVSPPFHSKPTHGVIKCLVNSLIEMTHICAPRKQAAHQLNHECYWETKLKTLFDANWATLDNKATATNQAGIQNSFMKQCCGAGTC